MNILVILDVDDWAIANLTNAIVKYNERHNFYFVYAHPKNVIQAVPDALKIVRNHKIDVIHIQYWNSGWQMLELVPELREYPAVLTHHNHKHLKQEDWKKHIDTLVVPTQWGFDVLKQAHKNVFKVPHGLNLDEFSFIHAPQDDGKTIGYVGRVLPHKNLAKICEAANKLNYKVLGSGYIDKPSYWESIDKKNLTFIGGVGRNHKNTWEDKNSMYEKMTCFVAYSTDEIETGTLPLLEAMARGVPVLTTAQGMARDLIVDGENGLIFDDSNFEEKLSLLMEDEELRNTLRRNARKTMHQYSEEKMAILYDHVYTKTVYPDSQKVSVIIPTNNRADSIEEIIQAADNQTYENMEIIVVDDGSDTPVILNKKLFKKPIQLIRQERDMYGLSRARNQAVLEARGDILVFCDDRLKMENTAVSEFVKNTQRGQWNIGTKISNGNPSKKRDFVENFSCVYKHDLVRMGMFNERIKWYGGASQDLRQKCQYAKIKHALIDTAKAHTILGAPKMKLPEQVWKAKLALYKLYGE